MLRVLKPFEYLELRTVDEAVRILPIYGEKTKIFAGGVDLVPFRRITKLYMRYYKG